MTMSSELTPNNQSKLDLSGDGKLTDRNKQIQKIHQINQMPN